MLRILNGLIKESVPSWKKKDYTCNTNVDQEIHETDSGVITRFYCKYFISAFGVFENIFWEKKLRDT